MERACKAVGVVRKLFTREECDRILQDCLTWPGRPAGLYDVSSPSRIDPNVRKGRVYNYNYNNTTPMWFKFKIDSAVELYQSQHKPIHLTPDLCEFQLVEYTAVGDHFHVHKDTHVNIHHYLSDRPNRKISLTIELSDPSQYEGANLRFVEDDGSTIRPQATQGDVFVFPSWRNHQVKPLVSGTRHALVCWYLGPFWG
jgi:hypothetical protein